MLLKKRAVRLALVVATVNYLRLLTNIAKVVRLRKSSLIFIYGFVQINLKVLHLSWTFISLLDKRQCEPEPDARLLHAGEHLREPM